jgi:adenosine kinase
MLAVMPHVDYVFGNETECQAFGEAMQWGLGTDTGAVMLKIARLPKSSGLHGRTVVITCGHQETLAVHNGQLLSFEPKSLKRELLVDKNGAGDAFVGGFMSQLVKQEPFIRCMHAAGWAAHVVIQESGCSFPVVCQYKSPALLHLPQGFPPRPYVHQEK